jgi:hypothetical protein
VAGAGALGVAISAAVLLFTPLRLSETETFMRPALGRLTVEHGLRLPADPFLLSQQVPFRNPEWIGDLGGMACIRWAESGVQLGKLRGPTHYTVTWNVQSREPDRHRFVRSAWLEPGTRESKGPERE